MSLKRTLISTLGLAIILLSSCSVHRIVIERNRQHPQNPSLIYVDPTLGVYEVPGDLLTWTSDPELGNSFCVKASPKLCDEGEGPFLVTPGTPQKCHIKDRKEMPPTVMTFRYVLYATTNGACKSPPLFGDKNTLELRVKGCDHC